MEQMFHATFLLQPEAGAAPAAAALQQPARQRRAVAELKAVAARNHAAAAGAAGARPPAAQLDAADTRQYAGSSAGQQHAAHRHMAFGEPPAAEAPPAAPDAVNEAVSDAGDRHSEAGSRAGDWDSGGCAELDADCAAGDHADQSSTLAALQRARQLEVQLEAAGQREALLRDSIAARDSTIRCGLQLWTVRHNHSCCTLEC